MSVQKFIPCCPECSNPVVNTFIIPGAEFFCMECKWSGGILEPDTQTADRKLLNRQSRITRAFRKVRRDYIPPSSKKIGCKKCHELNEYHSRHATESEIKKSKISAKMLFGSKEVVNET